MQKLLLLVALLLSSPALGQTTSTYTTAPTVAAVKALVTRPAAVQVVDANPSIFNWSTTPCTAADDVFQIAPTAGPIGCYTRAATPYAGRNPAGLEILSAGNFGNYSTLNAAIAAIGNTQAEIIVSKNQTLTASLTVPATVKLTFTNGGSVTKASTYTLTINGQLEAPIRSRVFIGFSSGDVTIARSSVSTCYAEWWGASVDLPSGSANQTAINATFAACSDVTSLAGTYHTTGPVLIRNSLVQWRGQGQDGTTKISTNSTTTDCVQIGPASYTSGNQATFNSDIYVFDITCRRSIAADPPVGGAVNGAKGFRIKGVIRAFFYRSQAVDDVIGYYLMDTVNNMFTQSNANRGVNSATPASDEFYGFYVDGVGSACTRLCFSLNASTFFTDTLVSQANIPVSYGFYFPGSFSDQNLTRAGGANLKYGIALIGPTALGLTNTRTVVDIKIVDPEFDIVESGGNAIKIAGTDPFGSISIKGGYAAFAHGVTSGNLIDINNARGVSISGGFQFIGYPSMSSTPVCLKVVDSRQVSVDGLWQDCHKPVVITSGESVTLTGSVFNYSQATGLTAVNVATSSRIDAALSVEGGASGQFSYGILFDGSSSQSRVDATKMVGASVTTPVRVNTTNPIGDGYVAGTTIRVLGLGSVGPIEAPSINFGGNTLSTYEVGAWTPTIAGSSTAGTQT